MKCTMCGLHQELRENVPLERFWYISYTSCPLEWIPTAISPGYPGKNDTSDCSVVEPICADLVWDLNEVWNYHWEWSQFALWISNMMDSKFEYTHTSLILFGSRIVRVGQVFSKWLCSTRCRDSLARLKQSRPDSGFGRQANVFNTFQVVPSSLGRGGTDLVWNENQIKTFLAMKFTTRILWYH